MNLMRVTKEYVVRNNDEDDTKRVSFRIRLTASDRKQALRHRYTMFMLLKDCNYIQEQGCDCRHCMNDWDCCGNLYPSTVKVEPAKRGIKVTQFYARNI